MVILKVAGVDQSSKIRFGNLTAKLNTLDVVLKNPLPDYAAIILQDGPLGYWRLNERTGLSAADATGNGATGTLTSGVSLRQAGATADQDLAELFDGVTGDIALTAPAVGAAAGAFSVEAWVKQQNPATSLRTLFTFTAGVTYGLYLNAGIPHFKVHATVDVDAASGSGALVVGNWYHLVLTYDGVNVRGYQNGVLVAGPTAVTSLAQGTTGHIGSTGTTNFTAGVLDEVAVYPVALSLAQVAKHYQAGLGNVFDAIAMPQIGDAVLLDSYSDLILSRFPVAYWRLNEPTGTAAADSGLFGHAGALTGGVTLGVAGATTDLDKAMSFDGTGRIQTADTADTEFLGTAAFSLECWINPSSIPVNSFERVLCKEHTSPSRNGYLLYVNDTGTGGYLGFERWSAGTSNADGLSAVGSIPLGKWTHIVATYDGSNMTTYINGVLAATSGNKTLAIVANPDPFTIGAIAGGGSNFRGAIDEAAIYGRALTPAEVLLSYTTGRAVFPWVGTVSKVGSGDPVERTGNVFVTLAAQNGLVAAASPAPFNLSDHADKVTTFSYTRLKVDRQANNDGTFSIKGSCLVQTSGLLPGMTIQLWSTNQGYAGDSFTVQDVAVTWPTKNNPQCEVTFGDPIVAMSVWVASAAQSAVLPITETKITDGAVSTPKLAAGSVTADKLTATLILATLIRAGSGTQHVEIDPNGVRAYDASGNIVVNIPDDGSPVTVNANLIAKTLQAVGNAVLQGTLNELALGAVLQLDGSQGDPQQAPALAATWDGVTLPIDSTYDPSSSSYKRAGLDYDSAGGAGGATKVFWNATRKQDGSHEYLLELLASDRTVNRSIDLGVGGSSGVTPLSVCRLGGFIYVLLKDQTAPGGNANLGQTGSASFSYVIGLSGGPNEWAMGPYTMPEHGTLVSITVDSGADSGTVDSWAELWDGSGNFLAQSGKVTLGVGHAPHTYGFSARDLPAGSTYYIGIFHANSAAKRVGVQNGGTLHYKQNQASVSNFTGTTAWSTPPAGNMQAYLTYTKFTTAYKVRRYSQSTLALDADFGAVATPITPAVSPVMASDGTNLFIVDKASGTGTIKWSKYDSLLTQLATVDTTYSSGSGDAVGAAAAGNADFGAWRLALVTVNGIETFDTTGARQANETFPYSNANPRATGLTYGDALADGARYWSLPGTDAGSAALKLTKHSTWVWTSASSVYWVGYTWYDSNATGGTHETKVSPRGSITMGRRQQLVISAPAIPGGGGTDDPNNIRFYMLPNASDPGVGGLKLQATQAVVTLTATTYSAAGAADPGSNNYPSGSAAQVKSQQGAIYLKGDGSWRLDQYRASVHAGAVQAATNNAYVKVNLDTADWDPSSLFDTTNHVYTCPVDGEYEVDAFCITPNFNTGDRALAVYKNGVVWRQLGQQTTSAAGGNPALSGSCKVRCSKNDTLDVRVACPGVNASGVQGGWADFTYAGGT